jgi:hypothetical protein
VQAASVTGGLSPAMRGGGGTAEGGEDVLASAPRSTPSYSAAHGYFSTSTYESDHILI